MRLRDKLERANRSVETVSIQEALGRMDDDFVVFVDVRDTAELQHEGTIPGALHIPRGSLEFSIDPISPTHREELRPGTEKSIIVYCASGLRSLLAAQTMLEMGLHNVSSLEGGFAAWVNSGGPVHRTCDDV